MLVGAGVILCAMATLPAVAFANAANPCGTNVTNGICPPTNAVATGNETSTPTTAFPNAVTITVSGSWSWADCAGVGGTQCSGQKTTHATGPFGLGTTTTPAGGCWDGTPTAGGKPGRSGVGWAMIWNDPSDPGYEVDHSGFDVGATGTNGLNSQDQKVHIQLATPCGPTDDSGIVTVGNHSFPSGQWGPISHVYESAADVPALVCVNMYDPHGDFSISDVNNGLNDFNAVGNGDNSIQTNAFNPTLGGGSCFSPVPTTSNCYPTKSVSPTGAVAEGTLLTYTITVKNDSSTAGACDLSDVLSVLNGASFTNLSAPFNVTPTGTGTFGFPSAGSLTWDIPSLGAGDSASFQMTANAHGNGTDTGSITNTATVTTGCVATDAHPCSATVTNTVPPPAVTPNCFPTKSVIPTGSVPDGTELTYTVTATNNTTVGGDCVISDVLSVLNGASFTDLSAPFDATAGTFTSVNPGTLTWTIDPLGAGDSASFKMTAIAHGNGTETGSITNTATVTTGCTPTDANPCTVNVTNMIPPPPPGPECTPTKTADPTGSVPIGTVITYTVSIKNNGGSSGDCSVTDALTTDSSATTFTIVSGPTVTSGSGTVVAGTTPNTWTFSVSGLAPGASTSFVLAIKITGAGTINSSTGTGSASGLVTNSATSTENCTLACVVIVNTPVLYQLTKTVSPTGTVPVGTTLTYTVTLTNTSQNDATASELVDDTLSGTAGVLVNDGTGGTTDSFSGPSDVTVTKVAADHYQWTIPADDLGAGKSAAVTFTAVVTSGPGVTTSCLLSGAVTGQLCLDNSATAVGITTTVQNLTPPPTSQVQAVTTTPSTGALDEANIALAGFLFLGGLGLILMGILAKTPGYAPRRVE